MLKIHTRQNISSTNDQRTFIEYPSDMQDVCNCIEEYDLGKREKVLIVFDDMVSNKKTSANRPNYLLEAKNLTFPLYCFCNHASQHQKMLDINRSSHVKFKSIHEVLHKMYCKTIFMFGHWIVIFHEIILHFLKESNGRSIESNQNN